MITTREILAKTRFGHEQVDKHATCCCLCYLLLLTATYCYLLLAYCLHTAATGATIIDRAVGERRNLNVNWDSGGGVSGSESKYSGHVASQWHD